MADYFTEAVVQPDIPLADMTPLERLVLGEIFDTQEIDASAYFSTCDSMNDCPLLALAAVRDALAKENATTSRLHDVVTERLSEIGADAECLDLDLSGEGIDFIFQDIVRRSPTLSHITVEAAFTCSKMRPDGFGGMATLITAKEVMSESTTGLLQKWLADAFP